MKTGKILLLALLIGVLAGAAYYSYTVDGPAMAAECSATPEAQAASDSEAFCGCVVWMQRKRTRLIENLPGVRNPDLRQSRQRSAIRYCQGRDPRE